MIYDHTAGRFLGPEDLPLLKCIATSPKGREWVALAEYLYFLNRFGRFSVGGSVLVWEWPDGGFASFVRGRGRLEVDLLWKPERGYYFIRWTTLGKSHEWAYDPATKSAWEEPHDGPPCPDARKYVIPQLREGYFPYKTNKRLSA